MRLVSAVPIIAPPAMMSDAEGARLSSGSRRTRSGSSVPGQCYTERLGSIQDVGSSFLEKTRSGEEVGRTLRRYSSTAPGKLIYFLGMQKMFTRDLDNYSSSRNNGLCTGVPSGLLAGELGVVS